VGDKVYQLLAHGRWFFPGTQASSTTNTVRHDTAYVMLKVALKTKNQIKSYHRMAMSYYRPYCDGKIEQQDTGLHYLLGNPTT
jgi:hypothetical protein